MNLYDLSHPSKKKKQQLIKESRLAEFAPPGGDDGGPDEDEILFKLAKQWWLGSEQDMIRVERTLASMGWEIGEDEGSYDDGGVFVVRAGDVNGKSYQSWPHEELSLDEGTNPIVKHRIGLTVTDPNHPMVSKRNEPFQRTVRVPGDDPAKAINAAIAHYRRKGYKVHDHHYMGTVDYTVNEFAVDGGGGEGGGNNGHWYTDGEIGDRVGDAWFEEFDVSNDMFNIDARGEKAKQALVNYANQWFNNKGYNVNVVGAENNEEDHDLKWYIVGSLDEPQVDEAAPDWLRRTAGAATGALAGVGASFPGTAIAGPIGGAVAGAYGAKAGYDLGAGAADWVYDKVTGKRVPADKAEVDEELTMKHQRDHSTQRRPDISNSLADRDFDMSEVPNVAKSADGHPTVKWRHHGHAGHTRVEPTLKPTTVQRKDTRPIPSFLKKGVAEGTGQFHVYHKVKGDRMGGPDYELLKSFPDKNSAVVFAKSYNEKHGYKRGGFHGAVIRTTTPAQGVAEGGYRQGFADPNAPSLGGSRRKDDEGNSEFDDRQRRQTGMIFYNVDDAETARAIGLQQTRTGKWYLRTGNRHAQQTADRAFGIGRIWYPESVEEAGVFGFMSPEPEKPVGKKPKLTLSQIRDMSKQEDEKTARYVRSNDLPKNPNHMRVVHDDVELGELSNELLGRYKKELGVRASAADRAGDYDKGHEYFKKINRATIRQGNNDARRHAEKENDMMETRLNMMRKAGYDL